MFEPDNTEVIKQRALRKEQARLHKQQKLAEQAPQNEQENETSSDSSDAKKARIAEVVAKAKAQKLANKDK